MMGYQLEYLHGREEQIIKVDGHFGDNDHLGIPGESVGGNYYDLLPFGYEDAYGSAWFYRSVEAMMELEQAYGDPGQSRKYRAMLAAIRKHYNDSFWTERGNGDGEARYIACIDALGEQHDYGLSFLNTQAIAFGLASEERAERILAWLDGGMTITSQGSHAHDIYRYGFAPRCTTIENSRWWAYAVDPIQFLWDTQIQNGGASLFESYYDIMARFNTRGPDDAYKRLLSILYRYAEPDRLTGGSPLYEGCNVQGGGTPGGLGVMSFEFPETSMLAGIVLHGFLGAEARADGLLLRPRLPKAQPSLTARNIYYHGTYFDFSASGLKVAISTRADHGVFDFEINGRRLHPPFSCVVELRDGVCVIKPLATVINH